MYGLVFDAVNLEGINFTWIKLDTFSALLTNQVIWYRKVGNIRKSSMNISVICEKTR